MKRLLAALALAAAFLVLPASAAHAAPQGWTPKVCNSPAGEDARICTNMYIDSASNVNWVQVCSTRTSGYLYQGTFNNGGLISNSTKWLWGPASLPDTAENECKTSPTGGIHVGNSAWLYLDGRVNDKFATDASWFTCQYVTGASC